ncbi:MAG: SufE family protein [Deltaproteobacteria bacterium]|nr:MAG: SufE family protein [Deltaproteobacteria bacterium]
MDAQELIETFELLDDWEDRYAYLIELGRKLPPFDPADQIEANRVRGCVSRVWLTHERRDGRLYFKADSDAFIVKGLVAILVGLYSGRTPEQIRQVPIEQLFEQLGLSAHLTPSRRNGFFSMVARMRALAEVSS